jgi:hypothetical protein
MRMVSAFVARSPAACWRHFTNAALLAVWVPGLRKARLIATGADGLPLEVSFEFADSLTYSLRYTHDADKHEVRWEPSMGRRDGVRGFARFDAEDAGTRVTYGIEAGDGRSASERAIDDPHALLAAFVRWMHAEPDG